MGKRRDRLDIFIVILNEALNGAKITNLVYRLNLNSKRFKEYSSYLIEKRFLEVLEASNGSKIYKTTDKGREFLRLLSIR